MPRPLNARLKMAGSFQIRSPYGCRRPSTSFLRLRRSVGLQHCEQSYPKDPKGMRILVQALRQVNKGVGSASGMTLSLAVGVNPKILYRYISLAVGMAISALLFWAFFFSKYDVVDKGFDNLDGMGSKGEARGNVSVRSFYGEWDRFRGGRKETVGKDKFGTEHSTRLSVSLITETYLATSLETRQTCYI
ncbi:hypothetical protein BKA65DRAFT_279119 [Rhexocercosporidium sp. MPI-PUGE-AT-0058]|nr:hypothetical protein BKA65DRAFT_279119 [Rhexocercosporidium sp. MPI-PUGE-AT-0058]